MNSGKSTIPTTIATGLLFSIWLGSITTEVFAAVQDPVDAKYEILVPKGQKKIAVGEEKDFSEGTLNIKVLSVEHTRVEFSANGGETISLEGSTLLLVPVSDETMCTVAYLGKSGAKGIIAARCDPMTDEALAAAKAQAAESGKEIVKPIDLIAQVAKGELVNPFTDDPKTIAEGRSIFLANSCNGCHGGTGGGGMGPPLSNAVWVYGNDDDTLFRLVTLGTDAFLADGFSRVQRESVVGPMPPFGKIIENSDHLWKILVFIRSLKKD
ncbi:MAG: c-type cytochrome [Granulosicoccus sp.]